jgi:hypothetical protein
MTRSLSRFGVLVSTASRTCDGMLGLKRAIALDDAA